MKACAPGKVILSGEHAVVYGAQAIAIAIRKHTYVSFSPITESNSISTLFSGISSGFHYPLHALSALKSKLDTRFDAFVQGDLPIQKILSQPDDLLMYTLSALVHHLPVVPGRRSRSSYLPVPGRLSSESELPPGAGMGSSASAIAATLVLFENLLDKPLSAEQRFELVRFCERLQHGKGSAIDAAAVTYGGMVQVQQERVKRLDTNIGPGWYWIFTGQPSVSTGECVQFVRQNFATDHALWDQFSKVTAALADEISHHHSVLELVKENHQLLKHIQVVPDSAVVLIEALEAAGGAAKISGAGAHRGSFGGLVIAYMPEGDIASALAPFPQYAWGPLEEDRLGARYLND